MSVEFIYPWIFSNIAALILLFVCFRKPELGRNLFGLLFLVAGLFNAYMVIDDPGVYLNYEKLATFEWYGSMIGNIFSQHGQAYMLFFSALQLFIAIGLLFVKPLFKPAILAAIIFLLIITPLGIGSAFPAPLILILGLGILLKKRYASTGDLVT